MMSESNARKLSANGRGQKMECLCSGISKSSNSAVLKISIASGDVIAMRFMEQLKSKTGLNYE